MILTKPSYQILTPLDPISMLKRIELAGRTCYKSEDRITEDSALKFVKAILTRNHESVIEHESISVRFICDRGVSHEIVRHRLASYSQESTRYCSSVSVEKTRAETAEDVITLYRSGLSIKRIAEMSNGKYSETDVYQALDDADVERRPKGNHGNRNQDAFKMIDTPEKAYLMGIFISDGSIRQDLSQVSVTQHRDYVWYLKVMLETVLEGPVGENGDHHDCRQLCFSGEKLGKDLFEKGLVPNKSYDTTPADVERLKNAIPTHLVPDFLRGMLDGDGCVRFFRQRGDKSVKGSANLTFSGNHHVMGWVADLVKSLVGYDAHVRDETSCHVSRVIITNKDAVSDLCRLMFRNFRMPFGHPKKVVRVFDELPDVCPITWAHWADPKFQVIEPNWLTVPLTEASWTWIESMDSAERSYTQLRNAGWKPEQARSVLPNSLKTEIVTTMNLRSWRHFFELRTARAAHPQMREIAVPLLEEFQRRIPIIFDGITPFKE